MKKGMENPLPKNTMNIANSLYLFCVLNGKFCETGKKERRDIYEGNVDDYASRIVAARTRWALHAGVLYNQISTITYVSRNTVVRIMVTSSANRARHKSPHRLVTEHSWAGFSIIFAVTTAWHRTSSRNVAQDGGPSSASSLIRVANAREVPRASEMRAVLPTQLLFAS